MNFLINLAFYISAVAIGVFVLAHIAEIIAEKIVAIETDLETLVERTKGKKFIQMVVNPIGEVVLDEQQTCQLREFLGYWCWHPFCDLPMPIYNKGFGSKITYG
jgi:hypothetical protein